MTTPARHRPDLGTNDEEHRARRAVTAALQLHRTEEVWPPATSCPDPDCEEPHPCSHLKPLLSICSHCRTLAPCPTRQLILNALEVTK
jgi:hypothetical protein